jgi:cytochrome c peroxidase
VVLACACVEVAPGPSPTTPSVRLSDETVAALRALSPASLPAPPTDRTNSKADDASAAAFGHQLFFDPGFSGALLDSDNNGTPSTLGRMGDAGKVACAGCHIPESGFVDSRSSRATISLGAAWGRRKSRALLDVGQAKIVMWDGRHDAAWNQPFEATENAAAMNTSRLYVAEQVYKRYRATYETVFGPIPVALDDASRFPQLDGATTGCRKLVADDTGIERVGADCHGVPGDAAEYDHLSETDRTEVTRVVVNMGKALEAYERLLSCGPGRFDRFMHGEADALTEAEQRGAALFVGQRQDGTTVAGCNGCHSGPFFSDQAFHNVGLKAAPVGPAGTFPDSNDHGAAAALAQVLEDPINVRGPFSDGDDGRLPHAVGPALEGAFRTPSLRCVSRHPTFMHTGQVFSLADVVGFFDRGGDTSGYLGTSENVARHFTAAERDELVAFLEALDGNGPDPALLMPPK